MNKLPPDKQKQVISCLIEGNSLRSTVRITDVHRTTIQKLLVELGTACSKYQDGAFRNLKLKRIQCDEIWCFVGCKEKNSGPKQQARGWGDIWTWVAMDSETKLVPCWLVGKRDLYCAKLFLECVFRGISDSVPI